MWKEVGLAMMSGDQRQVSWSEAQSKSPGVGGRGEKQGPLPQPISASSKSVRKKKQHFLLKHINLLGGPHGPSAEHGCRAETDFCPSVSLTRRMLGAPGSRERPWALRHTLAALCSPFSLGQGQGDLGGFQNHMSVLRDA